MRRIGATIRGFGDYKIGSNTIMRGGMSPPMITNSISNGAVIIRHREYLRDIFNSQDFSNITFDLNPGITSSFPWLSQIAMSFAQYRFRGLVFEFKTTSSDTVLSSSASTSLGTVVMATQYNALDNPFTNKFEMENWEYSVSTKPSVSCLHPIECAKSQTPVSLLWTRNGPKPGDERLYDLGNFNIATVGMQGTAGTSAIGELWCSYEIELFKPQFIEDNTTQTGMWDDFQSGTLDPPSSTFGNVVSTFPFGQATGNILPWIIAPGFSNYPNAYLTPLAKTLTIKDSIAKRLLLNFNWRWSTNITMTSAIDIASLTGCKFVKYISRGTYHTIRTAANGESIDAGSWFSFQCVVEVTSDNALVQFNNFAYTPPATTATDLNFFVTELAPDVGGYEYV